ncbi:hypothetical protein GCM10009552_10930 [Rothia nasimurium]
MMMFATTGRAQARSYKVFAPRPRIPVGARLARDRMDRNDDDVRDNRSRAGALLQYAAITFDRGGGGGPWRDLMEVRGVGGSGPKGTGQDGPSFSPRHGGRVEKPRPLTGPEGA